MTSRTLPLHLIARAVRSARASLLLITLLLSLASVACSQSEPGRSKKGEQSPPSETRGRGGLISAELIGEKSLREVEIEYRDNGIGGKPRSGVALYRIVYETIDPHGRSTQASGALAIPRGLSGPLPFLSYQHGTVANRNSVASQYGFDIASVLFGGDGYVVAIPDYLGLGESPGLHPYVHATSLATAVIDMLRASRELCRQQKIVLDSGLYLLGYSEGGYATMAAHRAIEAEHATEFPIIASAPMAGPYDMSGTMREFFMKDTRYGDPFYLPYVVLAYNEVYKLAGSLEEIFAQRYAERLPELFDGSHEGFDINPELPPVPKNVFNPTFFASFRSDSLNPLRRALVENDLTRWTPRAPMRLYHCIADDRVPYDNAEVAYESFRKRGAAQVELVTMENGGHGECGWPSIIAGKKWFDEVRGK
jgi:pimeloyl-ACP methyl ester carboxylesterase